MNLLLVTRRTHMYLALFLTPWILVYALSTFVMNHRATFRPEGGESAVWETERDLIYNGSLPSDATPAMAAEQILMGLDLRGSYAVRRSKQTGVYRIDRNDAITPRRITFDPSDGRLVVKRLAFSTPLFLEQMHRRRGYRSGFPADNAWAFIVDLVIVALVFWVASGVWMWWSLRAARKWGAVCAFAGAALFTLFLVTI